MSGPSVNQPLPDPERVAPPTMVSVNSRGGVSGNQGVRVAIGVVAFAVLAVGAMWGVNQYRAWKKERDAAQMAAGKAENKAALVGRRRSFSTDPEPARPVVPAVTGADKEPPCVDAQVLLGPDGKPVLNAAGVPMRICKDGRVYAQGGKPIPMATPVPGPTASKASRYGGELMVPSKDKLLAAGGASGNHAPPAGTDPVASWQRFLQAQQGAGARMMPVGMTASGGSVGSAGAMQLAQGNPDHEETPVPAGMAAPSRSGSTGGVPNQQGAIGGLLRGSRTDRVSATMLGDRNMILPKGRSIDCSLSTRLVNEVSGLAQCVLSSNVYSDNGRVLLLERGSEATGEYVAMMAQGQRRLFVLWTRVKTPNGVVINLDSPASDALGTTGLDGYVDNRWGERLGAAVLLSLVQDAIAYETARVASSNGGGAGTGIFAFQNTRAAGDRMINQVLQATIAIKPTLYKNQGDRVAIYVARDLDFGSVYALRSQ